MSRGDTRFNPTGPTEYSAMFQPRIHTQPHPDGAPLSSAFPSQSRTNSSLSSGAVARQSHLPAHEPEFRETLGNSDQSSSLAPRTPSPTFPVHPLPAQFSSGSLHTPHNSFPGHYVLSSHPPLFQSQQSQTPGYHGYHPQGPCPYPPTRYLPLPPHEARQYFQRQSSVQGRDPSYEQAPHLPLSIPQFAIATSNLGSSHERSYHLLPQYAPHPYGSTDIFGLVQQHPSVTQWYYGPSLPRNTFTKGYPVQVRQHSFMNYAHRNPHTRYPHPDGVHPAGSDSLPSPSLEEAPSSRPAAVVTPRGPISPAAGEPPEKIPVLSSPKTDSQNSVAGTSRPHDRPLVRRHYHPHPPSNRSEWVMWVGNVPNDATHDELWRFLKQPAPAPSGSPDNIAGDSALKSIFLISRSNCAFANYQSGEQLNRAIAQFNGRKLRPSDRRCPRLVCRARRKEDDLRTGVGAQRGMGIHTHFVKNVVQKRSGSLTASEETISSKSRRSDPFKVDDAPPALLNSPNEEAPKSDTVEGPSQKVPAQSPSSYASTTSSFLARYFPKRFFILKSLTRYDLDLSIQRGVWATQKHNEAILDQAFRTSKEVILVFSANRSGEFYGYARMASGISRGNHSVSWAPRGDPSSSVPLPSTSHMPARGIPEQPSSLSLHSSEMFITPSERRFIEASPSQLSEETKDGQSAAEPSEFGSTQERWSAPPALESDTGDPGTANLPPQGFSPTSAEPHLCVDPSSMRAELEGNPAVWVAPRNKGDGMDGPGHLGPLPPVLEMHAESGVEGQPAQPAAQSTTMHIHSEGQEREESWGGAFRIEWLRTQRVPFHRTRHLRNPWNHDREIKVSRDGTELEPGIGQQLVDSWSSLADERAGGNANHRRTAGLGAGRHGIKPIPKPGAGDAREGHS